MRGLKKLWKVVVCVTAYLYIPLIITLAFCGDSDRYVDLPFDAGADTSDLSGLTVNVVYNNATQTVSLDDFTAMVVAASVSVGADSSSGDEDEMIKALAVLVRTDVAAQMGKRTNIDSDRLENTFVTKTWMKNRWGDNWKETFEKIRELAGETSGQVLTYNGEVVRCLYTKVSMGSTMSGEKLLGAGYEYLVAVECQDDLQSKDYECVKEYDNNKLAALVKAWEKKNDIDCGLDSDNPSGDIQIIAKTDEGYVTGVQVGDVCMSGEKFAAMMELNSPFLTLEYRQSSIKLTSRGVGQGFGMSLYTANVMAAGGTGYKDILAHFYKNCVMTSLNS